MLEVKRTDQSTPTKLHSDNTNSTVTTPTLLPTAVDYLKGKVSGYSKE
jgi:hypothetical protein